MDRKRINSAPLMLEHRSMHGASQNETLYPQFPSSEPKISKFLPDLPFSLSPEYKFSSAFKEELFDLWPDIPSIGSASQPELQNNNRGEKGFVNNEHELSNETAEAPADYSPSTSYRQTSVKRLIPIVDLADSPTSQNSYSSEEDSDLVIYEGTTRREPCIDRSVVCLDNEDQETQKSLAEGDQIGQKSITLSQHSESFVASPKAPDLSTPSQLSGDEEVASNSSDSQSSVLKDFASCRDQLDQRIQGQMESHRAVAEKLMDELKIQKQNFEWQEAKIRYLETKLQERNDFELKLETVNKLNDMLEKKLSDLEKHASNLPIFENEVKRLKEKTRLLEEDKRSKEELGQTISNLIDDKTNLKTENESLTSIAGMLEKENSTLKQRCETLEKAAEKATICTGDNLIAENCCIRTKELRDRMTESLENEFKCSICEEIFIDATVTNCNHVFCAHCLSEWMKKKKDCPYCRKHVSQQCRAPVIDEFVLSVCKSLSEKMHAERVQVVQERKTLTSKKVPQPTSSSRKSATAAGAVRVVPIANLRSMPAASRLPYMRSMSTGPLSHHSYYPQIRDELLNSSYDNSYYYYPGGASSTATATATSSMASSSSSTAVAPPVQMLPLDARISRVLGTGAQSTATASSSMHVSSTSSTGLMPASATVTPSASSASSSTSSNHPYPYSWSRSHDSSDTLANLLNNLPSSLYDSSRPTVAAVNPFSTMDVEESSTAHRTQSASHRTTVSGSLSNRMMYSVPQMAQDL